MSDSSTENAHARRGLGLQGRLLLGLAVLLLAAISSTGWGMLALLRRRLSAVEEDRARSLGEVVLRLVERAASGPHPLGETPVPERLADLARSIVGLGGVEDLVVVDAELKPVLGEPRPDELPQLRAALAATGPVPILRDGELELVGPVRAPDAGDVRGAARVRFAVSETVASMLAGASELLVLLTIVDGGLILLFGALFLRSVIGPVRSLVAATGRVASGDLAVVPVRAGGVLGDGGEVAELADAFARMTRALAEQRERLESSRRQIIAQEKLATVGRLAAGVAHEIGNPLTAILGYVELLGPDVASPDGKETLRRVRSETERIHGIIHGLLDYARPVAEAAGPVSVGEVVAAAIDLCKPQPRLRAVALSVELPADLPPVAASSEKLLQVVLNLLLNAGDALGERGGHVAIAAAAVDGEVTLDVSDDGPGVPPADRERIFDPFFSTKEPGAGTGLGLAVCRSIVEAYGGKITLAPSEKGARFRLTLPTWKG